MTGSFAEGVVATLLGLVFLAGGIALDHHLAQAQEPVKPRPEVEGGRRIYQRDCVYCHGRLGEGTTRGPRIDDKGTAAVHYMVSTGRMPIQQADQRIRRSEPLYTDDEIRALIDYVEGFVTGPEVPEVRVSDQLLSRGARVYRLNCAACHQLVGTGGVLIGREAAPSLHLPTATQIGDTVRAGPGEMPAFGPAEIPPRDLDAVASYITREIQQPTDAGGLALGHFGPFSEGAAAWLLGVAGLLGISFWIGKRT